MTKKTLLLLHKWAQLTNYFDARIQTCMTGNVGQTVSYLSAAKANENLADLDWFSSGQVHHLQRTFAVSSLQMSSGKLCTFSVCIEHHAVLQTASNTDTHFTSYFPGQSG